MFGGGPRRATVKETENRRGPDAAKAQLSEPTGVTIERAVAELAKLGFADVGPHKEHTTAV